MREMKDSGIEWIGEIPKHWKCCKQKYGLTLLNGRAFKESEFLEDGKYKVLRVGNLFTNPIWHYSNLMLEDNKYCQKGDLLYSWSMSYAPFIWSGDKVIYHYHIWKVLIDNILCKKFVYYYLLALTEALYAEIHETTMGFITMGIMNNSYLPYCNLEEQQQIANFLDTQCSKIDATAEDIQKEISLLEDYKKSLIYNVISNGINHSAYSTETDEVWGNVPQGWKLVDIKYLFDIVKRIAGKEGYDVLSVTQKGLKVKDITSGDGQLADNYSGYQFVYPTDYVMNHMDLLTGWVDCSEFFGVTSPDYRVFRLMDKAANNLVYYKYVMQCCYMNKIFYSLGQGVSNLGRWRLQTSSFNNFKVPAPPKAEQDEIANFLDSKCTEIDTLIADKKRQLDILADYKKSLIYEYVTGKKEVPVNE